MLPIGKVREVERLLAEGRLSQRKIARVVGVSRGVISLIARGERPDYRVRRKFQDELAPQGPIERCPGCGGRVYVPCRLCHVRKLQADEQRTLEKLRRRARMQALKRILRAIVIAADQEAAAELDGALGSDSDDANQAPPTVMPASEPRPEPLD